MSMIGDCDCIGMESCIDMEGNGDSHLLDGNVECEFTRNRIRIKRDHEMKKREFPPPIPSLAQTENLHSHMPWILKRFYTNDGRLILREEKVRHHEYFRVHRANGRLTLHLVPMDDDVSSFVYDGEQGNESNENEYCDDENEECEETESDGKAESCDGEKVNVTSIVSESSSLSLSSSSSVEKCMSFSSCMFDTPVRAIRPVHS